MAKERVLYSPQNSNPRASPPDIVFLPQAFELVWFLPIWAQRGPRTNSNEWMLHIPPHKASALQEPHHQIFNVISRTSD